MDTREKFCSAENMSELLAISKEPDLIGHVVNRKDIGDLMAYEISCHLDNGGDMYPLATALCGFQKSLKSNADWFIVNDDADGIEGIEFTPVDNKTFENLKGMYIDFYDTVGWRNEQEA